MNARSLSTSASELYHRWRQGAAKGDSKQQATAPACDLSVLDRCLSLRLALIVWLMLGAAVSLRTVVRPYKHTVFPIFAASAEHWWGNCSLYELYPGLDRFRYPPLFALFVTPFCFLGLTMGGIFWSWFSISVFVAGLRQYVSDVIPSAWTRQRTVLFLILGGVGALRGLWNAQSNALIAGFVLLGTAALARSLASDSHNSGSRTRNSDAWLAAMFLAVAVCLKLTPIAPLLLLAVLWPRRLGWRLLVVMVGLFLLPFLTRPPGVVLEHYRDWVDHLMESGNIRWIGFRDGWTIWIVLNHVLSGAPAEFFLGEPMHSSWYRLVQLTSGAFVLVWCLWQRHRAHRRRLGPRWLIHVSLSMGLAWLMLFGPAVEHATYVFLAPPLLWAFLERRAWPFGQGLIWVSVLLIMVLGWGVVARWLAPDWPVLLTALPAGTALFMLWLIGYARNGEVPTLRPPLQHRISPPSTQALRISSTGLRDETAISY
jgi:hypothetical protein